MYRSLVVGGAGFIGSHLCRALIALKHTVICIDNLSTGSYENIRDLVGPNFIFREMNVQDIGTHNVTTVLDYIFHLACPASPTKYQADPIGTLNTCFIGTRNLAELAAASGARLIFTSTSEVYGDALEHPQRESYFGNTNFYGPRACYDEGKRIAETLLYNYRKVHNVNTGIVRIFNTYGPNMADNDGRSIPSFIVGALQNKPLVISGDGSQTRSFCYISDIVDALLLMAKSNVEGPINLGNPSEYSILEAADIINSMCGNTTPYQYIPSLEDDPQRRCPDISRAKTLLGWEPKVDLKTGLGITITKMKHKKK